MIDVEAFLYHNCVCGGRSLANR